jgi:hypothetical protein
MTPEGRPGEVIVERRLTPEERGAQLEAFCREIEREARWDAARTILTCFAWSAIGVLGMALSVRSSDARLAPIVFWGALAVCNGGILLALHGFYVRGGQREG